MQRFGRGFDVDPGSVGKQGAHVASTFDLDQAPELRQERRQRRVRAPRQVVAPERVAQLCSRRRTHAVDDEVREEKLPLAPRQLVLYPPARDVCGQPTAEVDPRARQRFAKVTAMPSAHNRGMAKILVHITTAS